MHLITSPSGVTICYHKYGIGPPLMLVHGSFSDHETNWVLVKPLFAEQFTVYAIACHSGQTRHDICSAR